MAHDFDAQYWDEHWRQAAGHERAAAPPNPHLVRELAGLSPGRALDAGCGEGAEAIWLATQGWQVTAADISADALARAAARATQAGLGQDVQWIRADLTAWEPAAPFELVTTHYAHPTMPQLEFYERLARWVAPGGTLLIVGHLHRAEHQGVHGHAHEPPAEASATPAGITGLLEPLGWRILLAEKRERTTQGRDAVLHDVIVRAVRSR